MKRKNENKYCFKKIAARRIILVCLAYCSVCFCNAQHNDSITRSKKRAIEFILNTIRAGKSDSSIINENNENTFLPYEGRIIRKIYVRRFGFDRNFIDTGKVQDNFGTRLMSKVHITTNERVIKNNIFLRENTPLNAYNVADNERYLRSLDFIQDARIFVNEITTDSVDLLVIIKDIFSISLQIKDARPSDIKASISDANLFGMAQKIQLSVLSQREAHPSFGYELLYNKTNIAHTFVNAGVIYTTINPDLANGMPDERALSFNLELPLYSQHSRVAGGLTLGKYQSDNIYRIPDSFFYQYGYNSVDGWIGYNIGSKKLLYGSSIKDRKFIALRYLRTKFFRTPFQVKDVYNFRFNNREALLAQLTFFRKEFYKANYIYGFGITEDVPDGYNLSFTTGLYRQFDLKRIYAGIEANRYIASNKGDFLQYFLKAGSFINKGKLQDNAILLGASAFSRLIVKDNVKFRQYISISYSKLFDRVGLDQFDLNNIFGLRYFSGDSIFGTQRISLHTETFLFLKYRVLNYRFAPFVFADASLCTPEHEPFSKSDMYYVLGCGVRTRNENLIFGTTEFRFAYFPRTPDDINPFKLTITTNLRFRQTISYISEPEIIRLNSDPQNAIY